MIYNYFFGLAQGIEKTINVPIGTIKSMQEHIQLVEKTLNIKREKYEDNPEHWEFTDYAEIEDDILCEVAEKHNLLVRDFYEDINKYGIYPSEEFEELTNEIFQTLLPGLQLITVKPERWTGEYYTNRMQTLYEVMRGRETEGISFDTKALTIKQATAVILLFAEFLDHDDRRLDVAKGQDWLSSSYDGGYIWCEKCGAVTYEYSDECTKRGCPLKIKDEDED